SYNSAPMSRLIDVDNRIVLNAGDFSAYNSSNILDSTCSVAPHNSVRTYERTVVTKPMSSNRIFEELEFPIPNHGKLVISNHVNPYSRMSTFTIGFNTSISRNDEGGYALIALYRDDVCVSSEVIYCPGRGIPAHVNLSHE